MATIESLSSQLEAILGTCVATQKDVTDLKDDLAATKKDLKSFKELVRTGIRKFRQ